ncbi:MAG: hypothetical protein ACTSSK_13140 [Candidatus Heimdallarchaeota archaeon]
MSITKISCDLEVKNKLTALVARKYGKIRGVLEKETSEAIRNHCMVLEEELAD